MTINHHYHSMFTLSTLFTHLIEDHSSLAIHHGALS